MTPFIHVYITSGNNMTTLSHITCSDLDNNACLTFHALLSERKLHSLVDTVITAALSRDGACSVNGAHCTPQSGEAKGTGIAPRHTLW